MRWKCGSCDLLLRLVHQILQHTHAELLACIPAVEAVRVMSHQERQLFVGLLKYELDWSAEITKDRSNRLDWHITEDEGLLCLAQFKHSGWEDLFSIWAQKADCDRDVHWELHHLSWSGRDGLL